MTRRLRENKRVLTLRCTFALADTLRWGPFAHEHQTRKPAEVESDCPACRLPVELGEPIVFARRLEEFGWRDGWVHEVCPVLEALARATEVKSGGRAVSSIGKLRRDVRCADCGQRIPDDHHSFEEVLVVAHDPDGIVQHDEPLGLKGRFLCGTCAPAARSPR